MRILLLAALLLPLPAAAQETRASAAAKFAAEFKASDLNKDGSLDRREIEARVSQMRIGGKKPDAVHTKRMADLFFARGDTDKNGRISQREAQALLSATFDRYDVNRDGKIGGPERGAAKKDLRQPR